MYVLLIHPKNTKNGSQREAKLSSESESGLCQLPTSQEEVRRVEAELYVPRQACNSSLTFVAGGNCVLQRVQCKWVGMSVIKLYPSQQTDPNVEVQQASQRLETWVHDYKSENLSH